ncbi:MAG: hypothetical protein ACK5OC_16555 [Pirellula sp.]
MAHAAIGIRPATILAVAGDNVFRRCVCNGKELKPSAKKCTKYVLALKKTAMIVRAGVEQELTEETLET